MGLSKLLTCQGRLTLVNSVLSALPTFYMCALNISLSIFEQNDKYKKHSLSNHGGINRKGGCLVAWKNATRPKH
jgi:hypothetical protein